MIFGLVKIPSINQIIFLNKDFFLFSGGMRPTVYSEDKVGTFSFDLISSYFFAATIIISALEILS